MGNGAADQRSEPGLRRRPIDCPACESELVLLRMVVDGNDLVMESCERCDERRWHLAGTEIDLEEALAQVGEHAGRRR